MNASDTKYSPSQSSIGGSLCIDFCSGNDACVLTTIYTALRKRGISLVGGTGAEGRGFAVVAVQVKKLAEEIKELAGEVDTSVNDVKDRAGELNQSIAGSQQVLGQSVGIVGQTEGSFEKIITAAEGAVSVQTGIANVIQESQQELQVLFQFFNQIKDQYQEVVRHIQSASRLGTTKSTMFEDMDNMISQISLLVDDMEGKG